MKRFLLQFLFAFALSIIFISNASAQRQPQCNDRDNVLELLAKKYKETTIAAGVTNTGGLIEVLSDQKSGTWTIIVTSPRGMSCLVAAGEGWRQIQTTIEKESSGV